MVEVSVVLPAYKEGKNLECLLPEIQQVFHAMNIPHEVLVVDTPTPKDESEEVARRFGVRYIPRKGGERFGDAYRTGIFAAQGTYILFMDADGSHPPSFIPRLLEHRGNFDVVMASRYVAGGGNENNILLVGMSRLLNVVFGIVLGIPCRDISNSFKLYKGNQLRDLALKCNNFDVIPEVLLRLQRANSKLTVEEIPFKFERRLHGESKRNLLWFIVTYSWTLVRLRLSK